MDVKLPNGKILKGVPDDYTREDVLRVAAENGLLKSDVSTRGTIAAPAMQGLTFGFADELGGLGARIGHGIAGLTGNLAPGREGLGGQVAAQEVAGQRADLAGFRERNPITSLGAEMAGSLVSGGPLAKWATAAPGLTSMLGRSAVAGMGGGALAGVGAADENRLAGGAVGGTIGGLLGAGIPAAATLVGKGGNMLANAVRPMWQRMTQEPTTRAGKILGEYVGASGMTPAQLRSQFRQLGPDATLAEAAGEAGTTLAQGVTELNPLAARTLADKAIAQRAAGILPRVRQSVAEATGITNRLQPSLDALRKQQVAKSDPLYAIANAKEIPLTDNLKSILARPPMRRAFEAAKESAETVGEELPPWFKMNDFGEWEKTGVMPDMRAWDRMKQGVDRLIDAEVDPVSGRMSPKGRDLTILKKQLLKELDGINPDYASARAVFAGDAALESAMRSGERMLTMKTRDVHQAVKGMTPSEREAFLTGAVEAIRERSGRSIPGQMRNFNFLQEENVTEKLRALLPPGKEGARQMAALNRQLRAERTLKETENAVLRGSQTAMRTAAGNALGIKAAAPTTTEALQSPMRAGLVGAANSVMSALSKERQPTIDALTQMVFSGGNANQIIAEMSRQGVPPAVLDAMLRRLTASGTALAPAGGLFGGSMVQ